MSEHTGKSRQALIAEIIGLRRELEEMVATASDAASADVLRQAKRRAEDAVRAKTRFLTNMSHELRTPMTAILGSIELLLDEGQIEQAPPRRIELLVTLRRNASGLMRILDDILDLSKIEAGKLDVTSEDTDVMEVIRDTESLMGPAATEKSLGFDVAYSGPIPTTIRTDPKRLRQIMMTLMGNAVRYTDRGGVRLVVGTHADPAGSQLRFSVLDTGCGIAPACLQSIFEPFRQGDESTTRRHGGSGIGLALARELARLLGGDLKAESIEGRGSCFHISLPMPQLPEEIDLFEPEEPNTNPLLLPDNDSAANAFMGQVRAQGPGGHVLLVEDGSDNRNLIGHMLRKAGFDVTVAENGEAGSSIALESWRNGDAFALVLMDMQMPVMDGYTATRRLRSEGYTGPIVALTAHAVLGERERCLEAGCDDFATKPINRENLVATIVRNLGKDEPD